MTARSRGRVLIAGLGIAGTTLAWWLDRGGWEVTVVERAPAARSGGYMIDFWGAGYDVAVRMGIEAQLRAVAYSIDRLKLVRDDGAPLACIRADAVREFTEGRAISLMRGDLAEALLRHLPDTVEIRFDDHTVHLCERLDTVEVGFASGVSRVFDLVVGADGVHSQIRAALFPESAERALDFWTAAVSVDNYPHRDPGAYVSYTQVGRQVARYALRSGRTAFLFVFRAPRDGTAPPGAVADQLACLRHQFGGGGWECAEILSAVEHGRDLYFDRVAQAAPPAWSRDRIALVGDAAYCPSLLAGEGASLAMVGAYVLAGELNGGEDVASAFARYERRLRPAIEKTQRGALALGSWFAPKTALGLLARNGLSRLAALPGLDRLLMLGLTRHGLTLPSYPPPTARP